MNKFFAFFLAIALLITTMSPAHADGGSGIFIRNGVSAIGSPVANQTYVFDFSGVAPQLRFWNGTSWLPLAATFSNFSGIGPPGVSNDGTQGYVPTSQWWDTVGLNLYVCISNGTGAAVWNVVTNRLGAIDGALLLNVSDVTPDFVVSGLLGTVPGSGFVMTTPSGVAYVNSSRLVASSSGAVTYTASKDTYDYLQTNNTINHIQTANGAGTPVGQTGLLLQKVVTNGSQITGVTQIAPVGPLMTVSSAITANTQAINEVVGDARYALAGTQGAGKIYGNFSGSSGAPSYNAPGSADQVLGVAHTGGGLEYKTITQGGGITVTDAAGSITIAASSLVNTGTSGQIGYYASTGSSLSGNSNVTVSAGALTLGASAVAGSLVLNGATSGTNTISVPAVAGTGTQFTLPNGNGSNGQLLQTNGSGVTSWVTGGSTSQMYQQVRLYETAGLPFATGDTSNLTTLYVGPCYGNHITIFNTGTGLWTDQTFAETSFAIGTVTANTPRDVFVASASSTTITVSDLIWTNATTRATALTLLNGRYVLSSNHALLYVGTYYPSSTTQTQDTATQRLVYSYFNRQFREAQYTSATANWTYASTTIRSANAATNPIQVMVGVQEDQFSIENFANALISGSLPECGIGINSSTVDSALERSTESIAGQFPVIAKWTGYPALGLNTYYPLESTSSGGSVTFYGTNATGSSAPFGATSGLFVHLRN